MLIGDFKAKRFRCSLFAVSCFFLLFLFIAGSIFKGAQSWFSFGAFSFQPVDFAKLVLVLLLAKYFPEDILKLPMLGIF